MVKILDLGDDWMKFRVAEGLAMECGVEEEYLIQLAIKEAVDNALDEAGTCKIEISKPKIIISNDGMGIKGDDKHIAKLFSIRRPHLSSKIRQVSRGALGNGLRVIAGVTLVTPGSELIVSTKGRRLKLMPRFNDGGTDCERLGLYQSSGTKIEMIFTPKVFKDNFESVIEEYNADYWGKLAIEMAKGPVYKDDRSPHWFDSIALRNLLVPANNRLTISKFLIELFGSSIVTNLKMTANNLLSCRVGEIHSEEQVADLLNLLRDASPREVNAEDLGNVGNLESFPFYASTTGTFKSSSNAIVTAGIPYFIEAWGKRADKSRLLIFVNKSPVTRDYDCFRIKGKMRILYGWVSDLYNLSVDTELELRINIMTPYCPKVSGSKVPDLSRFARGIKEIIISILDKANKQRKLELKQSREINREHESDLSTPMETYKSVFDIRKAAKERGVPIGSLLVLSGDHDPYNIGTPTHHHDAQWFKRIMENFGYGAGKKTHLRRMHYQIASMANIERRDGDKKIIYKNTDEDWSYLQKASKVARTLGYVSIYDIIDMRNPMPVDYSAQYIPKDLSTKLEAIDWQLPSIALIDENIGFPLPSCSVEGYEYSNALQPIHVETWIEKSSMNDILLPLCKKYSLRCVQGVGYLSITAIGELLKKVQEINKPTIILYISDFDPAGNNMPFQAAREIEYFRQQQKVPQQIMLKPIMLTREQVEKYKLPRVPLKDKDKAKEKFENKHGEGGVELDALEALHPGEFEQIVEENVCQFIDLNLKEKFEAAGNNALSKASDFINSELESIRKPLMDARKRIRDIIHRYNTELVAFKQKMEVELNPYKSQLTHLSGYVGELQERCSGIQLPEPPSATVNDSESDEILFDSRRDYHQQLKYYKKFRGKNDEA